MRIHLIAACLLLASVVGAQQKTTITETMVTGTGDRVSGSCDIQAVAQFSTPSGVRVVGPKVTVAFTAGAFSVALLPTDTATPASFYQVVCSSPLQMVSGRRVQPFNWPLMTWVVPTTGTVLHFNDVITNLPPAPSVLIPIPQLDARALTDGQYCFQVIGHVFSLLSCTGGGGGGTTHWSTLTSSQWAALTSSQWAALAN